MSKDSNNTRRDFFKKTAAGLAGLVAAPAILRGARAEAKSASAAAPIRLGVASYSLREFSRAEAIQMIKAIGTPYVCLKSMHLPYESTPEEFAAARKEFADAGLQIVGGGNNNLFVDTDEDVGFFFEYAKNAGMPLLVIAPKPEVLPRIEKFVKSYDIKVAIHNHGPEDEYFPAPSDALKLIKDMDPRVGLCVDVGHTTRTGKDVVEEIALAGSRVLDVHIKDLADLMVKESQCNVGRGKMPIRDIFDQLIKVDFQGYVNLEYEINGSNPLPGMIESFAYMRGVLSGMRAA